MTSYSGTPTPHWPLGPPAVMRNAAHTIIYRQEHLAFGFDKDLGSRHTEQSYYVGKSVLTLSRSVTEAKTC